MKTPACNSVPSARSRTWHMRKALISSAIVVVGIALSALWGIGCGGGSASLAQLRPAPGKFFVATNGNDHWSGSIPGPNSAATDGPFLTVARALEASRSFKSAAGSNWSTTSIYLRQGTYFLTEPLHLGAADSGLLLSGYGREQPLLSGGRPISKWEERQVLGQTLWVAPVESSLLKAGPFHQLWVNGRRAIRARHPNQGYLHIAGLPDSTKDWTQGQTRFQFAPGDLADWASITQAEVVVMSKWVESRLPVAKFEAGSNIVTFSKRSVFQMAADDPYYLEGAFEALDQPGEWFLDAPNSLLYYKPRAGERLGEVSVIAPMIPQLVLFEGTVKQPIERVRFEGLQFSHTEWYFPTGFEADGKRQVDPPPAAAVGGFAQAAIGVPGALVGEFVRDSSFDHCRFTHLGGYALELARGCQRNRIDAGDFSDLGAGGLRLGETTVRSQPEDFARDNTVANCRFTEGGRLFHSAIGIWIGQSPGNRLLHNEIQNFYYTGISVGWTWGYGPALATNTLVAFNHVHHIGVQSNGDGPILSDMAGIYTLGKHQGSLIVNNLWHDIAGLRYGGWGIYFDEGTSDILAVSNVVHHTTHGGFHQHYGATNRVYNNIFAQSVEQQVQRSRSEPHVSFYFATNIVWIDRGLLLKGDWGGDQFMMDWNVYFDARPNQKTVELQFPGGNIDQWRWRHLDEHSVIADPLFANPGTADFTLRPNSPALRLGFQPIDLREVGPLRP